jgi:predicted RNase H-like nuclease (RuvC/YqgF family)
MRRVKRVVRIEGLRPSKKFIKSIINIMPEELTKNQLYYKYYINTFKEYYINNKEKINEKSRKYYYEHKDKFREYHKKYFSKNKDKIKKYQKEYFNLKKNKKRYQKRYKEMIDHLKRLNKLEDLKMKRRKYIKQLLHKKRQKLNKIIIEPTAVLIINWND